MSILNYLPSTFLYLKKRPCSAHCSVARIRVNRILTSRKCCRSYWDNRRVRWCQDLQEIPTAQWSVECWTSTVESAADHLSVPTASVLLQRRRHCLTSCLRSFEQLWRPPGRCRRCAWRMRDSDWQALWDSCLWSLVALHAPSLSHRHQVCTHSQQLCWRSPSPASTSRSGRMDCSEGRDERWLYRQHANAVEHRFVFSVLKSLIVTGGLETRSQRSGERKRQDRRATELYRSWQQ